MTNFKIRTTNFRVLLAATCAIALSAPLATASAAEKVKLKDQVQLLEARLEALETEVRRFNRNSAAVITIDRGGSSSSLPTTIDYVLTFCTDEEYKLNQAFACPPGSPDISLTLGNGDSGTLYTFTQANEPDFDAIVALITNGSFDWVEQKVSTGGGGGTNSQREDLYFREFQPPGGIDLEDYSIGSITIAVDTIIISGNGEYILDGRAFYGLAD